MMFGLLRRTPRGFPTLEFDPEVWGLPIAMESSYKARESFESIAGQLRELVFGAYLGEADEDTEDEIEDLLDRLEDVAYAPVVALRRYLESDAVLDETELLEHLEAIDEAVSKPA